MIRKTKLIATLGPASDDRETLARMIEAGMNVARLNFSHGNHQEHLQRIERVREVSQQLGANIALMIDTRGFEIRTGLLERDVVLEKGADFALYTDGSVGNHKGVSVSYPELPSIVAPGTAILVDDGLIELEAVKVSDDRIDCKVIAGGTLRNRKGVNLPTVKLQESSLTDEDKQDLAFAVEHGFDYIAASFVNHAGDVREIREYVSSLGASLPIIAKIENRQAVENLVGIVEEADGTMVARGDLGVEIPVAEVPLMQKKIIRTTVMNGKPVITATQMLDSMERNPRPTRAEATDVANAIFDGTSAIMLSGETAAGEYPIEAVKMMSTIAVQAESALADYGYLQKIKSTASHRVTEAVSQAAITMADHLDAAAILTLTGSGFTSRSISKYRPKCSILAATRSIEVVRKLAMNWGVTPLDCREAGEQDEQLVDFAIERGCELGYFKQGDRVVVTAGISNLPGSTTTIRVVFVEARHCA